MSAPPSPAPEAPSAVDPTEIPSSTYARMAWVLRLGLALAVVLLSGAIVATAVKFPTSSSGYWIANNPLVRHLNLARFGHDLVTGDPTAYLTLGVYALIATPVVRVIAGLAAFAHHGDRRMTALTGVVLVLLLLGLLVVGPLVR
jgi:uncharacterized membrane protein